MLITTAAHLNNALRRLTYAEEDVRAAITTAYAAYAGVILALLHQIEDLRRQLESLLARSGDHA